MKNVLVYINPRQKFDKETKILVKIQIDNILDLGWKKEDIILVTNFPYEYGGVKAIDIDDNVFYLFEDWQNKIVGVLLLFELGLINDNELYFCHDFDHYQLHPMTEDEINSILGNADIGMTDYGRSPRWHMSCMFFKAGSRDIFELIKKTIYEYEFHNEENALFMLTENDTDGIAKRIRKLNITYNFWGGNIRSTYPMAEKPIRCAHFHLKFRDRLDFFMYGKNKLNQVLIDERLIKLFNKYGVQ